MINLFKKNTFYTAALLVSCFFIYGCENDMSKVRALSENPSGIEEAKNIKTVYTINGLLKAILTAPVMHRVLIDSPKIEFPNSLYVKFYDTTGSVESELSAKYGRYYENQNQVLLRDSIVAFNLKGDTIKTNELYWDQAKEQFYTDKPVTIIQQQKPLLARKGLISDQSFNNITMFDPVGLLPVADSSLPE